MLTSLNIHDHFLCVDDGFEMSACVMTHSFVQEQSVSSQMVSTQQSSQDADGAFKQVDIYILVECELCGYPLLRFFKFC